MQTTPSEPFSFYINLIVIVLSFYAAWVNLVEKRMSNFGFDALLLAIGSLWDSKQARRVRTDPKLIQRMGVIMLLFGIGGIYAVVYEFL